MLNNNNTIIYVSKINYEKTDISEIMSFSNL